MILDCRSQQQCLVGEDAALGLPFRRPGVEELTNERVWKSWDENFVASFHQSKKAWKLSTKCTAMHRREHTNCMMLPYSFYAPIHCNLPLCPGNTLEDGNLSKSFFRPTYLLVKSQWDIELCSNCQFDVLFIEWIEPIWALAYNYTSRSRVRQMIHVHQSGNMQYCQLSSQLVAKRMCLMSKNILPHVFQSFRVQLVMVLFSFPQHFLECFQLHLLQPVSK